MDMSPGLTMPEEGIAYVEGGLPTTGKRLPMPL